MRIKVPFGLHAYQNRTLPANAQELINFYQEKLPPDSKSEFIIHGTPGSSLYTTVGSGPIHGMKVMNDVLYVVSGSELYSVSHGTSTLLGSIAGNKRVSMEHNGTQLCIVSGSYGYIYDTTNGLQQITDSAFYPTNKVSFLDGRFLFPRTGTNQFFASDYYDGTSFDALNFEQVKTKTENILTQIADHGELWLFTRHGAEVWMYNRNESAMPYSRIDGAYIPRGCPYPDTPNKLDNTFYWVAENKSVYRADGYKPTRISTHALEYALGRADLSDIFSNVYEFEGHSFYELTFDDQTWRYGVSTGEWHKVSFNHGRYYANCTEVYEDQILIGDYQSNNLYTISLDLYKDNGEPMIRTATSPIIHSGRNRAVMDRLEIDVESGKGLSTGQGANPQMMLEYSDNGGKTWSKTRFKSMGKIGEYSYRVRFSNLGMFYQRIFRISISDPIKCSIIDAYADIEQDDSY